MKPNFYMDIEPRVGEIRPLPPGMPQAVYWFKEVFWVCHGVFSDNPGVYALALPELKTGDFKKLGKIRIFSEKEQDLNTLADELELHQFSKENSIITRIKASPLSQRFVSYSRKMMPSRGKRMSAELFHQKINEIKALPSIPMKSQTNGQRFFLSFCEQKRSEEDFLEFLMNDGRAKLNTYGLSAASDPVILPDF